MEDHVIKALSDPTRRRVLQTFQNRDSHVDAPSLATSEAAIYDAAVERQKIELYHNHLPRLDDMGLIEWDHEQKVVETGPRFEEVLPLLEVVDTPIASDERDDVGSRRGESP